MERSLTPSRPLLLDGQLGGRSRLETLVGNRQSTFDGQPIRAGSKTVLGALDSCQLLAQILLTALVELVLVEVGRLVAGVEVLVFGSAVRALEPGELALDPLAFGR